MDWFIVLGPLVALPLILLFAFVGCGFHTGGIQNGPLMLRLFFHPQDLDMSGGSVQAGFQFLSLQPPHVQAPDTAPKPAGTFAWTTTDDLTVWRSLQVDVPLEYTNAVFFKDMAIILCTAVCTFASKPGGNPSSDPSQVWQFPLQGDVTFFLTIDANTGTLTVSTQQPVNFQWPGI
jgi:hypothetical protein